MGFDAMTAFLVFATVAAVTPGPSNLMVLAAGARGGLRGGLPCLAGVVVGMALLIASSALGLGALITALPGALTMMRWGGAALLLWLAWQIARAAPLQTGAQAEPVGFWKALTFQWINPKSWIVATSAAATYGAATGEAPFDRALWMGALFAAAAAPSGGLWLALGSALQRALADARRARVFNAVMGLLLAASVVFVVA